MKNSPHLFIFLLWVLLCSTYNDVAFGEEHHPADDTCINEIETEEEYIEIVNLLDDEECSAKVDDNMCNEDTENMLRDCLYSCLESDDLLEYGHFRKSDEDMKRDENCRQDARLTDEYDKYEIDGLKEFDKNSCLHRRNRGDCIYLAEFMEEHCPHTCMYCFDPTIDYFDIGVPQIVSDTELLEETVQVMVETMKYMVEEVMSKDIYKTVREACRNEHELCSEWAAEGKCHDDIEISTLCGPACQSCNHRDLNQRCPDNDFTPIFQSGDLNKMFERIISDADYNSRTIIHSKPPGPWIITIDDFLTKEECDHLISIGEKLGFRRSLTYGEDYDDDESNEDDDEDNDESNDEDDDEDDDESNDTEIDNDESNNENEPRVRNSSTAWCNDDSLCFNDSIISGIIYKIGNLTGVPKEYSEDLQLLHYVEGQYYMKHHDNAGDFEYLATGPRILTVFLYLNSVEEGGGTKFHKIDEDGTEILVKPKPGMALIWPSVRDDDLTKNDYRTFHEAMNVTKGVKYGTNAWLRLKRYKDNRYCDPEW